jgi:tight adherence protein B
MAPAITTGLIVTVVLIIFATALFFAQFLSQTSQNQKDKERRAISRRLGTLVEEDQAPIFRPRSPVEVGRFGAWLDVWVRRAGSPYPLSSAYVRIAVSAAVFGLAGAAISQSAVGLVLAVLGGSIPVLVLQAQAEARASKLTEQLPDALDLIARSLQAGHAINEAFRFVAEEAPLPLAQEFGRVYEEYKLGRDLRECLQNLNSRNPANFDLQLFVSAILLQRDTGGNLVEILNNISGTLRARFVFQGKVQSLTSEARLTGWILCVLPFVITLAISVVSPNYLKPLFTDTLGIQMVMYALCSFTFGVFAMRAVSKVEA